MKNSQLSDLIFNVTASAIESRPAIHQASMVGLIREVVNCDAAWWGWSSFTGGRTVLVNSASYNLPKQFDAAVRAVAHIDPFIRHGRNLSHFSMAVTLDTAPVAPEYKAFADSFNIASILNGHCRLGGASPFHFFMSLYRKDAVATFSAIEVDDFRIVLRHLEQSLTLSLRTEINARAPMGGEASVVDVNGQIVHSSNGFKKAIAQEKLSKPQLAAVLKKLSKSTTQWTGKTITLTTEPYAEDLVLVRLSQPGKWDILSPREKSVAELYVSGLSMRAIATANRVSPNTVRNQLATIYKKTATRGKIALTHTLTRSS